MDKSLRRQQNMSALPRALSSRFTKNSAEMPASWRRRAALVISCALPMAPPTKKTATFLMRKPLRTLLKVFWATKLMAVSKLRCFRVCGICSPSMRSSSARFFIASAKRTSVVTSSLYMVTATRAPLGQLLSEMVMSRTRRRTVSRMLLKTGLPTPSEISRTKASSVG
ncbi:hypothetical protein F7725_001486 [Dissostichus mawsoni]|uniref:Uncharacterized protein n=1 Tax=Dissostichus mawsoni TaxID=36200 RepID=A0A7J5Y1S6_DISMA|nr:hypothetical protein F7725_001486 [Dissostichus mawsoni]